MGPSLVPTAPLDYLPPLSSARRRVRGVVAGLAAAAVVAVGAPAAPAAADNHDRPWTNAALGPDERAALLLAAMTLEEKIELMTGDQGEAPAAFYNGPIERLGIPELSMADAGVGIASRGWELPGTGDTATALPAGNALGASWDPVAGNAFAEVVAEEALATGHEMLLGPTADPVRTPFWGRIADSPGEDPYFISRFTTPFVDVVQDHNVIANLKHYAGYSQEVNRGRGQNSIISERALREVWTLPYRDAIEQADLGSVMCSFNKVNGVFACENDELLDRILRQELGFTGFVITDFGAIHSTEPSIRAGTDMETGTAAFYDGPLLAAVQAGRVPVSLVDRSVLRILRTMFAIGVFDRAYPLTAIPVQEHGQVAREVQTEAITLLRNRGVLPLGDRPGLDSIALIGADANITARLGGASHVKPTYQVPVLDGLGDRADEEGIIFRYAAGNDPVGGFSMIETSDMTAVPSSVLTPESGTGRGVTARYWFNRTFQGPEAVTRTERQVAYDSGFVGGHFEALYASQVPPVPQSPTGEQSVVYTGFFAAPATGTYRLGLSGWGDASLFLDDNLVVQNIGTQNRWSEANEVSLQAGQRYRIRVTYQNRPLVQLQPGTMVLQWAPPAGALEPSLRQARQAARNADVAVVYLRTYESEERDRVSLKLPQNGDRLIRAVSAVNPNTIVVIASGGPVTMPWRNRVGAVVQNWFGGQEEGNALAGILFGDEDPSGHTPITFPRNENALGAGAENPWATYDDLDVEFYEDVNIGYRGYLAGGVQPAFPFGHGLSYTEFAFDRLRTQGLQAGGTDDTARVRLRVSNVGSRDGTEVVQVYLGPLPGLDAPQRKLAGFNKVDIREGARANVTIDIDRQQFSYWDEARNRWVTPRGRVPVYVGKSATEIELSGFIQVS
jgi:beta-glucosidase